MKWVVLNSEEHKCFLPKQKSALLNSTSEFYSQYTKAGVGSIVQCDECSRFHILRSIRLDEIMTWQQISEKKVKRTLARNAKLKGTI